MRLRTDLEKLIEQARAQLAEFERVEAACAKDAAALQEVKMAANAAHGTAKAKARATRALGDVESKLAAGAKAAAAARRSITATLRELQAELDKLPKGES